MSFSSLWKKIFSIPERLSAQDVVLVERARVSAAFSTKFDTENKDYLESDYGDYVQRRYGEYVKGRYDYIDPTAYPAKNRPDYALALSGGGIRSASFGIGVIQGLCNEGFAQNKPTVFDKLSYVSSVSGGGYAGAALGWYQKLFNLFPFGNIKSYSGNQQGGDQENSVLAYMRQHGKYLTPTSLGISGLIASILTSAVHSLVAYTLFFGLVIFLLIAGINVLDGSIHFFDLKVGKNEADTFVIETINSFTPYFNDEYFSGIRRQFSVFFMLLTGLLIGLYGFIVLIYAMSSFLRRWFSAAYTYRIVTLQVLGSVLKLILACVVLSLLPLAVLAVSGRELDMKDPGLWGALLSGGSGFLMSALELRQQTDKPEKKTGGFSGFLKGIVVAVFAFFVLVMIYVLGEHLFKLWRSNNDLNLVVWVYALVAVGVAVVVNINQISPHKMYRDRLMETFLKSPDVKPDAPLSKRGSLANSTTLVDLDTNRFWSPYQLINCNVILNKASNPKYQGRLGDSFLLSPMYCGAESVDYVATKDFARGQMTLATAMSISGAAANPHAGVSGMGSSTTPLVAFLMTFFGLRLGFWVFNPGHWLSWLCKTLRPNYLLPGLNGLLNRGHNEKSMFIELSDGGHFDNTGVYELVRRRVTTIILADGSADPNTAFDDFGNMLERVRVDFGVSIRFRDERFDLSGIIPGSQAAIAGVDQKIYDHKYNLSTRGYAIGDIVYPESKGCPGFIGKFIYIKATMTRNLPGDLYAYNSAFPLYPNQPTLDQFFDERQFESYRELGYQLTKQMLSNPDAMDQLP